MSLSDLTRPAVSVGIRSMSARHTLVRLSLTSRLLRPSDLLACRLFRGCLPRSFLCIEAGLTPSSRQAVVRRLAACGCQGWDRIPWLPVLCVACLSAALHVGFAYSYSNCLPQCSTARCRRAATAVPVSPLYAISIVHTAKGNAAAFSTRSPCTSPTQSSRSTKEHAKVRLPA